MKTMKKVLFLLLFLVGLGAANLNSQVRIGGDGEPNAAAVLDLNADDDATPTGNKGALALPRISLEALSGEDANLNGMAPIAGMLVYNTNTTLGEGIYFYDGSNWVIISGDGVVGNEVTNAITGGGLVRAGSGTATSPYTLGIDDGGVTSAMIADGTIATIDLANGAVTRAKTNFLVGNLSCSLGGTQYSTCTVTLPSGCNQSNTVATGIESSGCTWGWGAANNQIRYYRTVAAGTYTAVTSYICIP